MQYMYTTYIHVHVHNVYTCRGMHIAYVRDICIYMYTCIYISADQGYLNTRIPEYLTLNSIPEYKIITRGYYGNCTVTYKTDNK